MVVGFKIPAVLLPYDVGHRLLLDIYSHYLIDSVAQWFRAPAYIVGGRWFDSSPCHFLFPRSPWISFQHGSSNRVLECVVFNRAAQGGIDSGIRGCVGYL